MKIASLLLKTISTLALTLVLGCAGGKGTETTPPSQPKVAARPATPAPAAKPAVTLAKSVFTIDESSRDPFFPRKKAPTATAAALTNPGAGSSSLGADQQPSAIIGALESGLQGIGGTTDHRIAIINNTILEKGRNTTISLPTGNNSRSIPVRCRDITRDTVVLDVEGYGQVTVTRKQVL